MILPLIGKVLFTFFKLENDLSEIETSKNVIASFYLNMKTFFVFAECLLKRKLLACNHSFYLPATVNFYFANYDPPYLFHEGVQFLSKSAAHF